MFSSLVKSVTRLSPKALLSRYIANSLAAFFDVDPSLVESNLLHDTRIVLRNVHLKQHHVELLGLVVGRIDSVEFSWTWNTSSSTHTKEGESGLITNVSLTISGARFRVMKENDTKIEKISNKTELTEALNDIPDSPATGIATEDTTTGASSQDWKSRYLQQIVDHLTLHITDVEIVFELPSPTNELEDAVSLFLLQASSIQLVSLGRKTSELHSTAPSLSQRLSVGSIAAFVIPNNGPTLNKDDTSVTVEFDDSPFWEQEMEKERTQPKEVPCLPVLEPFTYSALVTRVSGRRFLDGILAGLEVRGEAICPGSEGTTDAITLHMGTVQAEAFRRIQSLLTTAESGTNTEAPTVEPNVMASPAVSMPTMTASSSSPEKVTCDLEDISDEDDQGYWTPEEDNGDRRNETSKSSIFVLPIRSMAVVLPNDTRVELDGCTLEYRTDGKIFTLSGEGGILVDKVHVLECNKWVVDAANSNVMLEHGKDEGEKEMPVVSQVIFRPEQIKKLVSSVNQVASLFEEETDVCGNSDNATEGSGTIQAPWSFKADGVVAIRAEGLGPQEWLSLEMSCPQLSLVPNTNNPDAIPYDFAFAGARVLSSSADAVDIRIPKLVTRGIGMCIDEDISIAVESFEAIQEVQDLVSLLVDAVQVGDNVQQFGDLSIPITIKQVKAAVTVSYPGAFCATDIYGHGMTWRCSNLVVDGFREEGLSMKMANTEANLGEEGIALKVGEIGELSAPGCGRLSSPLFHSTFQWKEDSLKVFLGQVDALVIMEQGTSDQEQSGKTAVGSRVPFPVSISVETISLATLPSDVSEKGELKCYKLHAVIKPSTGKMPDCSIRIKEVADMVLPGVAALSSPMHGCTILYQDDELKLHLPAVKVMTRCDAVSAGPGANVVADGSLMAQIPFPISFAVASLGVTSAPSADGSTYEIECRKIQAALKPCKGLLPDGSVHVAEISKISFPGVASLSAPVFDTSILLKDSTAKVNLGNVDVITLSASSAPATDATDTTPFELRVPFQVCVAIQSLVVASTATPEERVELLECSKVHAYMKPSATRLADCSIKVHEISKLLAPGLVSLSSPLQDTVFVCKDGKVKVFLKTISIIKLDANGISEEGHSTAKPFDLGFPLPFCVVAERIAIASSPSPDGKMQGLVCDKVQADLVLSSKKLPDGCIRIREISKLTLPGVVCLSSPVLDSTIQIKDDAVSFHIGVLALIKLRSTVTMENLSLETFKLTLPFPIRVAIETLSITSPPSSGDKMPSASCRQLQANLNPSSGMLPNGSIRIREIEQMLLPEVMHLSTPLLDTIILFCEDDIKVHLRTIRVVMDSNGSSNPNGDTTAIPFDMQVPFPVSVAIEKLEVQSCPSVDEKAQELECSKVHATVTQCSSGLPEGSIQIQEVASLVYGPVSLSSPLVDSSLVSRGGTVHLRLKSVFAVVESDISSDPGYAGTDMGVNDFKLPFPMSVAVESYVSVQYRECLFCGFGLTANVGVSRGGVLEMDTSRVFLPPIRLSLQEITSVCVPGTLSLQSPVQNVTIEFGSNRMQAHTGALEVVLFQDLSATNSGSTTAGELTKLNTPVSFDIRIDGLGVRSCPKTGGASKQVFSCRSLQANASPSQGSFLEGDIKVKEITTLQTDDVGLCEPMQSAIFRIRHDLMNVALSPIVLSKRGPPVPVSSDPSTNDNGFYSNFIIPLKINVTTESLVIKNSQNGMAPLPMEYLSTKRIVAMIEPSSVMFPEGVVKIEEVTSLSVSAGYLSTPIANLAITSSGRNGASPGLAVTVACSSIEAVRNSEPASPQPSSSSIELPCIVRLDVGTLFIREKGGLNGPKDLIAASNISAEASPVPVGTPLPSGQGYVTEASVALRLRNASVVEIRNILCATDVIASAVVNPNRLDLVHGVVVYVSQADISADFTDVNWSEALAPDEEKSKRELLHLPFATVGPIESHLKYKGAVISLGEARINFKEFLGDAHTNSDDIVQHYISIVKKRIPALLGQLEILGANVGDHAMMTIGRAALGASTASGCAVGSVVGVGIRDGFSGAIASGKKGRGAAEGDGYKFGDISRGLLRSVGEAAKSGAKKRGDDKYRVGDFSVGTAAATGEYLSENRERLSTAGGSGIGLAIGAAMLGPVGMVAGAYLGGRAAGSAARTITGESKKELTDDERAKSNPQAAYRPPMNTRTLPLAGGAMINAPRDLLDANCSLAEVPLVPVPPPQHQTATTNLGPNSDPLAVFATNTPSGVASPPAGNASSQRVPPRPPPSISRPPGTRRPRPAGAPIERQSHPLVQTPESTGTTMHHDISRCCDPPGAVLAGSHAPTSHAAVPVQNASGHPTCPQQQQQQDGYRFGDVTRGILARGKQKRGQDKDSGYKFGDFTRGLFG